MAISFIASSHSDTTTGSEPAGTASGDLLIAVGDSSTTTTGGPTGWTRLSSDTFEDPVVWYIRRGGSAPSFDFNPPFSGTTDIEILTYRGAYPRVDLFSYTDASAVSPSLSPLLPNCVLVCGYNDASDTTITVPSGMTDRTAAGTTNNKVAELALTNPGATGTKTFTTITTARGAFSLILTPFGSTPIGMFRSRPPRIWRGRRR